MADPFFRLTEISKSYAGAQAVQGVNFAVSPGEVIGLVGENGAGKSTLMKIIGGVIEPSSGSLEIDGVQRKSLSVLESMGAGIAFVHQELNLFDNLDVASNVYIGREPLYGGPFRLVNRKKLNADVQPLLDRLGVDFTPETMVSDMSIAQRQLLEIVKALSLKSRLVIMDEPTSSLTLIETDRLLNVVAGLKASGVSVIFISHRLNELVKCADRVVVLRDGRVVGELAKGEITHGAMIRLMIGRDLKALYVPPADTPGEAVLKILDVRTATYPTQTVSLSVRQGEILGLAGLVGAGRTELARAIFGIDQLLAGSVILNGKEIHSTVRQFTLIVRAKPFHMASSWCLKTASAVACFLIFQLRKILRFPTWMPVLLVAWSMTVLSPPMRSSKGNGCIFAPPVLIWRGVHFPAAISRRWFLLNGWP
jgi:ribose transport system ATP-binding protein